MQWHDIDDNNTYNINYYYYVSHDKLSEYVRACQPQHDSGSKVVHNSDHNDDSNRVCLPRETIWGDDVHSNEWCRLLISSLHSNIHWENVTMLVVVEDFNTNMTTYLARPERCKYGNNNNHVVMKCCIEYGTIAW